MKPRRRDECRAQRRVYSPIRSSFDCGRCRLHIILRRSCAQLWNHCIYIVGPFNILVSWVVCQWMRPHALLTLCATEREAIEAPSHAKTRPNSPYRWYNQIECNVSFTFTTAYFTTRITSSRRNPVCIAGQSSTTTADLQRYKKLVLGRREKSFRMNTPRF